MDNKNLTKEEMLDPLRGMLVKENAKKFLFVTEEALAIDLAWEIRKEGCEVKFFARAKSEKDVGDGFVEKVDDWQEYKDWADIIVFDDLGFGDLADKLRKEGKIVIGGSSYTDKLEDDREFGQEELKAVGVQTLSNWNFTDFDEAIKFVEKNPGRYVLKPSGKAQNEKELLFVGKEENGEDLIVMLEHYKKVWSKFIKTFQLQEFASGVEVAVGAFFNGKDFIRPININFEHKKMFPGEIGPSTGEMGTFMYWTNSNKIFELTLLKMKEKLAASGYVGYIDLNCIANSKGVYPLEWTARFGYPTISIQQEGVFSRWSDFFYEIGSGRDFDLKTKKGYQLGVVVAVPPFPFEDPKAFERYSKEATILFKKPDITGVHIADVKYVNEDWILAGRSGYSLIITATGLTLENTRDTVYERVKNVMIPNMFYRTDIGLRWINDSDLLRVWEYI
jgi:phosphoribosylamine--glycine ligase